MIQSFRTGHGHTLIELIAVMALLAALVAIATPGFREMTVRGRIRSRSDALMATFAFARAEAATRVIPVVICPGPPGPVCRRSSDWTGGWFVAPDPRRDLTRLEPPLRVVAPTSRQGLQGHGTRAYTRFQPDGSARGHNLTVVFCEAGKPGTAHAAILATSGRARQDWKHRAHAAACALPSPAGS